MSGQHAVRPKTGSKDYSVPKEETTEENTTNDEEFARRLQDELIREQEERDAQLARQLHEEEQNKRRPPQMLLNRRPTSATPIQHLFQSMFGLRPEALEVEDLETDTTPAMDPDAPEADQATASGVTRSRLPVATGATGGRGENQGQPRRHAVNRSPVRVRRVIQARSPERAARGRGAARGLFVRAAPDNSSNTENTTESSEETSTDLLPGVRVHPDRQHRPRRFGPNRRIVFHPEPAEEEPGSTQPNVRPIGAPTLGLGPRQATMDLPEGEYDPDFMVLDLGENVQQREANFVNVMRDPFLLMLLLMGRNPGFMVPDDVDLNDYESLWELAERMGEVRSRGMKEEEINKLPFRSYRKKPGSKETESCSICISDYKTAENVQILPCKHEFHKDCLFEWLKRNASCPVCRQDVRKK